LSVNVFGMRVLTGNTIFTSPTENETAILRAHPSHAHEGQAVCSRLQGSSLFLSCLKTLSIGPVPGIKPATSRSAAKRSIDWDNLLPFPVF